MLLYALTSSKYIILLLLDHTPLGMILLCKKSYLKLLYGFYCIKSHRIYRKLKSVLDYWDNLLWPQENWARAELFDEKIND